MSRQPTARVALPVMLCLAWASASAAQAPAGTPTAPAAPAAAPAPSASTAPSVPPSATVAAGAVPGEPATAATPGTGTAGAPAIPAGAAPEVPLPEVTIERDEPKYAAPTRRDRIGRIWAPVLIDGKGPYRMVLDTGASHSAVTQRTADLLGLPLAGDLTLLTGVTGSATVQALKVERMEVGELLLGPTFLPIVPNVFGGADGVLGREGLADMRIVADFAHDRLTITRSRDQHAREDFSVIPLRVTPEGLLVVARARVGRVPCAAIIDTGAQRTVGNEALRLAALHDSSSKARREDVVGVTLDVQSGENEPAPPIYLDKVTLSGVRVTFGDMFLFEHWHMTGQPTMLVGMDVIGSFDAVIIDYRKHEMQLLLRNAPMRLDHPMIPGGPL